MAQTKIMINEMWDIGHFCSILLWNVEGWDDLIFDLIFKANFTGPEPRTQMKEKVPVSQITEPRPGLFGTSLVIRLTWTGHWAST